MSVSELAPDELLAAEYALGLLEGEVLLLARGRIAHQPGFAEAVEWWTTKLAPLLDEFDAVDPGPELWMQIESALGDAAAQPRGDDDAGGGGEVAMLRTQLRYWRATAAIGMAASLAALVFALLPLMRAPVTPVVTEPSAPVAATAPPLVAEVPFEDTALRVAVMWLPERGELLVTAAGLTADGVTDHELWLLADEGAPRSLGVVRPGQATRVALAPEIAALIHVGSRVALSREPLGGKPPTADVGPVVAQGTFAST